MGVVGGALLHDARQLVADRAQGQSPGWRCRLGRRWPRSAARPCAKAVEVRWRSGRACPRGSGTGSGRPPAAGVSGWPSRMVSRKPWTAGAKSAASHQVGVDEVDAELDADEVGWGVAQHAGDERVEQGAAAEAQVDQLHAGARRRRCAGQVPVGLVGVGAVADRASVVQPHPAAAAGSRLDGGVGAQGDEFGGLVVRQPDLDVLRSSAGSPAKRTVPTRPGRLRR